MADTIFAIATGAGRAGVAVLRISGPRAAHALRALSGRGMPQARHATLVMLRDLVSRAPLDQAIVLWFPAPHSFTGEDVVELHLHGGRAVQMAAMAALSRLPGLRVAEPGEFSRRAYEHGKLDLTAAEGLSDLINAETAAQRVQALRQLNGGLAALYEAWRTELIGVLARLEAAIDFPDEDLPRDLLSGVRLSLEELRRQIQVHLADGGRGERLREGFSIAIVGAPNAGKSTLLNALARRDVAIVSATAGTTRDIVEVHLDLGGYPVVLADTAGLRESADEVEREGVRRALKRADQADLKLVLVEANSWPHIDPSVAPLIDTKALVVLTKADLGAPGAAGASPSVISAKTGAGIDALLDRIATIVHDQLQVAPAPILTRERHRHALTECVAALDRFERADAAELAAEDVRLAARALGRITGRVDVEDILDVVFREFCIGK